MRFAIVNVKGGVGKSTIACHLAGMLAHLAPTLLIDADPQASAASWAAWRREAGRTPSPSTVCLAGRAVLDEGKALSQNFVHTVIDAGGRDSAGLRTALLLAETAIVPIGASNFDSAAMSDLIDIIKAATDYNTTLSVKVLLSRIDPRSRDTGEMLEFLKENDMHILQAHICERVAYRRAINDGATVAEHAKDRAAVSEMNSFLSEVLV